MIIINEEIHKHEKTAETIKWYEEIIKTKWKGQILSRNGFYKTDIQAKYESLYMHWFILVCADF